MDRCVEDLCSDHHGDGPLPPKSPWRGLVLGRGEGGDSNGVNYQASLNQKALKRMMRKMFSSKHPLCIAGHIFSPFEVRSSATSNLDVQQNRAADTREIKRGRHFARKAFYSLTFKRAKNRTKWCRFMSKGLRTSVSE